MKFKIFNMKRLFMFAFFISGFTSLVYETIWPRYIKIFVGHATYAQILVLSVFLGGMAIGSMVVGKKLNRLKNPLKVYALIEVLLGFFGLFFHYYYNGITHLSFDILFPSIGNIFWVQIVQWIVAIGLIFPQSVLIGATFPLVSSGIIRLIESEKQYKEIATLYFINSIGASIGVLVTGFFLIDKFGLPGTSVFAGFLNFAVAWVAIELEKRTQNTEKTLRQPKKIQKTDKDSIILILLMFSFGTAIASFFYEIGWIRMLSLVLGSSTHSFEIMLSTFILGLALGGFAARILVTNNKKMILKLAIIQWAMGIFALISIIMYMNSFYWMEWINASISKTNEGFLLYSIFKYAICSLIMLPATFCAGMTMPIIISVLLKKTNDEGMLGYVYSVNTFGSILGVILGAGIILPLVGLKNVILYAAILDIMIGVFLFVYIKSLKRYLIGIASITFLVLFFTISLEFDQNIIHSGVFLRNTEDKLSTANFGDVIYNTDGKTATISVTSHDHFLNLKTNGKSDASIPKKWIQQKAYPYDFKDKTPDVNTQLMLGVLPLFYNPQAQDIAIIGLGSGLSSHFALTGPNVQSVVTIEIEPKVVEAAKLFYPANERFYDDPRSTLIVDDALAYFSVSNKKYDIIISEPSNPWISGIANLFTHEFYKKIAMKLKNDGVYAQWFHLYQMNNDIVMSVLKAVDSSFSDYKIYQSENSDIIIVCFKKPQKNIPDWKSIDLKFNDFEREMVDFSENNELDGLFIADKNDLHEFVKRFPHMNSDYYPYLDLNAEKSRYMNKVSDLDKIFKRNPIDVYGILANRQSKLANRSIAKLLRFGRNIAKMESYLIRNPKHVIPVHPQLQENVPKLRKNYQRFIKSIESGVAPDDWIDFSNECYEYYALIHQGTFGEIYEPFFEIILDYLEKSQAPIEVKNSINYMKCFSLGSFEQANELLDDLLKDAVENKYWLHRPYLIQSGALVFYKTNQKQKSLGLINALGDGGMISSNVIKAKNLSKK